MRAMKVIINDDEDNLDSHNGVTHRENENAPLTLLITRLNSESFSMIM